MLNPIDLTYEKPARFLFIWTVFRRRQISSTHTNPSLRTKYQFSRETCGAIFLQINPTLKQREASKINSGDVELPILINN